MAAFFIEDRRMLLREFEQLLAKLPDDREGIHDAVDFLASILKIRSYVPPTAEIVTILKHRKPMLFHHLKHAISTSSQLYIALQMVVDYRLALERLNMADDTRPDGNDPGGGQHERDPAGVKQPGRISPAEK